MRSRARRRLRFNFDTNAFGKYAHGLRERNVFQLGVKSDCVAGGSASETFEKAPIRMHVKRRGLLTVKWAESDEVTPAFV